MAPVADIDETEIAAEDAILEQTASSSNQEIPTPTGEILSNQNSDGSDQSSPRFDVAKHLQGVFGGINEGADSKLHIAARRGDHEMARLLLSGRSIKKRNTNIDMNKFPYLSFPCEDFSEEVTEEGKEAAANMINRRNRLGATPLWLAAAAGHSDTVKTLCHCGADLEIPDIKGQTPLFAAVKYDNVPCVRVLLEAGANPEGSTRNITTPIYRASRENFHEVVRLLIEYGADVNGRYAEWNRGTSDSTPFVGSVPLYMTIVYRNFECFRLLILNGAELHASNNDRGFGTSLVTGVLRHQCDVRYLRLIALCGGIRHGDKRGIDEAVTVFRQFTHGTASTRKECLEFLDSWNAQPMLLTQLCRICIRRQMGQKRLKNVRELHLPPSFERYVLFSQHFKK